MAKNTPPLPLLQQWQQNRSSLENRDTFSQAEVQTLLDQYGKLKDYLRPGESDEWFDLLDNHGKPYGVVAPRWLCHAAGLRHCSVNAVLTCANEHGPLLLLQLRSWSKNNDPGTLDLAVGGHPKAGVSPQQAIFEEMYEEIGLVKEDLIEGQLDPLMAYASYNTHVEENTFNKEWCCFYQGAILPKALEKVHFSDGEVSGLFLFPQNQAVGLLCQATLPLAGCLKSYLAKIKRGG